MTKKQTKQEILKRLHNPKEFEVEDGRIISLIITIRNIEKYIFKAIDLGYEQGKLAGIKEAEKGKKVLHISYAFDLQNAYNKAQSPNQTAGFGENKCLNRIS